MKNISKTLFCKYANYRKFAIGKSSDILQNVRLDGLFQNLKKSYMRFFLSLGGPFFKHTMMKKMDTTVVKALTMAKTMTIGHDKDDYNDIDKLKKIIKIPE